MNKAKKASFKQQLDVVYNSLVVMSNLVGDEDVYSTDSCPMQVDSSSSFSSVEGLRQEDELGEQPADPLAEQPTTSGADQPTTSGADQPTIYRANKPNPARGADQPTTARADRPVSAPVRKLLKSAPKSQAKKKKKMLNKALSKAVDSRLPTVAQSGKIYYFFKILINY